MTSRFSTLRLRKRSSEQERHELAVIDAAVRGAEISRPEDAELTSFSLLMREARELPSDGFGRGLDERYKGTSASTNAPAPPRSRARILAGCGAFVTILALLVVSMNVDSIGRSSVAENGAVARAISGPAGDERLGAESNASKGTDQGARDIAATGSAIETAAPASSTPARKVARTAELALATPGSNVEEIADDVIGLTDRFGGFISQSTVSGGDAENASARFEIQVPADQFQLALAQMSKLAHVRSRVQNTQDVTAPYSRARSRLAIANARRDRLTAKFAQATPGSREAKVIRALLTTAEARADARRAELSKLRNRVNFVGLGVEVVADGSVKADDRGTMKRALDTAAGILTSTAAALVIVFAVILPVSLIAGLIWIMVARGKRFRRNAALNEFSA